MGKIVKSRTEVNVGDKIDSYGCGEFIVLNRSINTRDIGGIILEGNQR